ncbi:MAG: hypothetical protein ABW019_15965 [Chitinophagaceae bacterium]
MKNKLVALVMLLVLSVLATSCYSSRKTGCPGVQNANSRFKG